MDNAAEPAVTRSRAEIYCHMFLQCRAGMTPTLLGRWQPAWRSMNSPPARAAAAHGEGAQASATQSTSVTSAAMPAACWMQCILMDLMQSGTFPPTCCRPRTGGAAGAGAHHNDEDADLAAAIAASLAEHSQQPQEQAGAGTSAAAAGAGLGGGGQEEWHDPTLEAAIRASLQQHAPPAEPAPASTQQEQQQEGAEPAAAGEAQPALPQLSDEPEAGSEGEIEVGLRLPDGARVTRRFLAAEHTLGHVAALAAAQGVDMRQHRLAQRFPRRVGEVWHDTDQSHISTPVHASVGCACRSMQPWCLLQLQPVAKKDCLPLLAAGL